MPDAIPNWREKKELLWGDKATDEERRAAAAAFLDAGRLSEALDFFTRVSDREGVEKVLAAAVETGDWFLFKRCRTFLHEDRREELAALAAKAMTSGKHLYALRAFLSLGDAAGAEKSLEEIRKVYPESELLVRRMEEEAGVAVEEPPEPEPPPKGGKGKKGK